MENHVDEMVKIFWSKALADKTNRSIKSEVNTYLLVCLKFGWKPILVSEATLMRYIVILAKSLSYESIKKYLGAVRHLHRTWGVECTASHSYHVYRVIQGVRRVKGGMSMCKMHITPDILRRIYSVLDMVKIEDLAFWCASLMAFLTFFRKSNLCLEKESDFDEDKHLQKKDIEVGEDWVKVTARWSKTNQFKERVAVIPIVRTKGSIFDLGIYWQAYAKRDKGEGASPAFGIPNKWGGRTAMTHNWFGKRLKEVLTEAGVEAWKYSGHSFRSGGATFAFECGLPMEIIKMQGDWRSDAYLRYVRVEWDMKVKAARGIAEGLSRWARG